MDYFPTVKDLTLVQQYPDELLCLEILAKKKYGSPPICPRCEEKKRLYYISGTTRWQCGGSKHSCYPMAGTIFHKSTVPLTSWFKAIDLIYKSLGAVPAIEIQRQIGVTYKTAWRMKDKICEYLSINKSYRYQYSSGTNEGGRRSKKYLARLR